MTGGGVSTIAFISIGSPAAAAATCPGGVTASCSLAASGTVELLTSRLDMPYGVGSANSGVSDSWKLWNRRHHIRTLSDRFHVGTTNLGDIINHRLGTSGLHSSIQRPPLWGGGVLVLILHSDCVIIVPFAGGEEPLGCIAEHFHIPVTYLPKLFRVVHLMGKTRVRVDV